MNHLILGAGEVGTAIGTVLQMMANTQDVRYHDPLKSQHCEADDKERTLHVCFPYSASFVEDVDRYFEEFNPRAVIIHSTVKIGTTRKLSCFKKAVYSPIRGRHPNLAPDIRRFVKYYAHESVPAEALFLDAFCDLTLKRFPDVESLEAAKLLDTTYYGHCLAWMRGVKKFCDQHNLDFHSVYTEYGTTYNVGYMDLSLWRPTYTYKPGPIGGHCVVPNLDLLDVPELTEFIKQSTEDPFHLKEEFHE